MPSGSVNRPPRRRGFLEARQRDRLRRRDLRKAGAVMVVVGVTVAGGLVAAAPVTPDPMPQMGAVRSGIFADKARAQEDADGFILRAELFGMNARSLVPLGGSPQSYQAALSMAGRAVIELKDPRKPPKVKVRSATITVGTTLACGASPQQIQLGGTLSQAGNYSLTPSLSSQQGVTGGGQGGSNGGQGSGSVSASVTEGISATGGGTTTISGTVQGTIAAGGSKEQALAKKSLTGTSGYVVVRETMVRMDACWAAQIVMWAVATLSTDHGDISTTAYSTPLYLHRDANDPPVNPPKVRQDPNPPALAATPNTAVAARVSEQVKPAPAAKPVTASVSKPAPSAPANTKPGPESTASAKPAPTNAKLAPAAKASPAPAPSKPAPAPAGPRG
ncbi:MspA family porin [Tsukamurella pseudospumae]|nr:MspA family porin [Tsukamurella pseudospumae]